MGDDGWGPRHRDDPKAQWNRPHLPKARKDRARWCRGKEGVEHDFQLIVPVNGYRQDCKAYKLFRNEKTVTWWCGHSMVCINCGKNLHSRKGNDCPDRPAEIPLARWT